MAVIDTEALSSRYRQAAIDIPSKRILITKLAGSAQEPDLSAPTNCRGFGRIHHFRRETASNFPANPLPIDPAAQSLGMARQDLLRAQVFQSAVCNWRCWYCYVPFELLSAHPDHSAWLTAGQLVDYYLEQDDPPSVIDLSGGQPDLTPEWTLWMMEALRERGLENQIYLWSDDNLSNDYFWKYLSEADRHQILTYPHYGRVCCFKGFDAESFAYNTKAAPALFDQQFTLMGRLLNFGIDIYAYATFPTLVEAKIDIRMSEFVDRLQELDPVLPIRTIPLKIQIFGASARRIGANESIAINLQQQAIECWNKELARRFTPQERALPVTAISLQDRRTII